MPPEIDIFGSCRVDDVSFQDACPTGHGRDVATLLLINKIANNLKDLGFSDEEIKRFLSHPNAVEEFQEFYRGVAAGGNAKMEVVRANGETILRLNVDIELRICTPVVNSDRIVHECTNEPRKAFNDSFSIPNEDEMNRQELAAKQKATHPPIARARKATPKTDANVAATKPKTKYSLINNDTLAILELCFLRRMKNKTRGYIYDQMR